MSEDLAGLAPAAWPAYLEEHSGLPGPRADLTLLAAAAALATPGHVEVLLRHGGEYPTACAAAALGRAAEDPWCAERARRLAADERWRVREAVAIGLQLLGDASPAQLKRIVTSWTEDPDPLVVRAALAAICEPRLLKDPAMAETALRTCSRATDRLMSIAAERRRDAGPRALRQALGYCWSVVIAARPEDGLRRFAGLDDGDADIAWLMTQNRKKKRLARLLGRQEIRAKMPTPHPVSRRPDRINRRRHDQEAAPTPPPRSPA